MLCVLTRDASLRCFLCVPTTYIFVRNMGPVVQSIASLTLVVKMLTVLVFVCFVCVEVLRPSQPNGVMSSVVSLPNHTFTGQA